MGYAVDLKRRVWQGLRGGESSPGRMTSIRLTPSPFDLNELSSSLLGELHRYHRHLDMALILRDPEDDVFGVRGRHGYERTDLTPVQFGRDSPLVRHFTNYPFPAHYGQLEKTPWMDLLPREERAAARVLVGGLFVPFSTGDSLVGLLVLGRGKSAPGWWRWDCLAEADSGHVASIIEEARLHHRLKGAPSGFAPIAFDAAQMHRLQRFEGAASSIAHDLNNILTAILTHAQMLEEEGKGDQLERHTLAIRRAVLDGTESVQRMRSFREPGVEARSSIVDMNDFIRSTLSMIEPRWRQGYISASSALGSRSSIAGPEDKRAPPPRLVVNLSPSGSVAANLPDLRRVLFNLMCNAVDALPTEGGRVEITGRKCGLWAALKVSDNGVGISPGMLSMVFEPFFTTKGTQGTGLGLAICRSIVARYGGQLKAESREGEGSTFTVLLPLAEHRAETGTTALTVPLG